MKKQLKLRKITEIPWNLQNDQNLLESLKWQKYPQKPLNDQNTPITTKMTKKPLLLLLLLLFVLNHTYQIENNKFEIKKTGPPSSHQNICNRLKTGYNYK